MGGLARSRRGVCFDAWSGSVFVLISHTSPFPFPLPLSSPHTLLSPPPHPTPLPLQSFGMYTRAQVERFRGVWNSLDQDKSGAVDVEEILNAKVFSTSTLKVTKAIFASIDQDKSGDVSLAELSKVAFAMASNELRRDILKYMRYLDAREKSEAMRAKWSPDDDDDGLSPRSGRSPGRRPATAAPSMSATGAGAGAASGAAATGGAGSGAGAGAGAGAGGSLSLTGTAAPSMGGFGSPSKNPRGDLAAATIQGARSARMARAATTRALDEEPAGRD
jgi:hypothetical protein